MNYARMLPGCSGSVNSQGALGWRTNAPARDDEVSRNARYELVALHDKVTSEEAS